MYPATSDSEKISFNQINRNTGHRIKYLKVDADTGEEVSNDDIMKGYKVDTDTYIEVSKDELENIALESTRTIDINEFVPKADIDPRYLNRPYYLVPDGKVGHDAFAVILRSVIDPLFIVAVEEFLQLVAPEIIAQVVVVWLRWRLLAHDYRDNAVSKLEDFLMGFNQGKLHRCAKRHRAS